MLERLHCIALHTVKYSDRSNIVTVYTGGHGRMSLLMPAGNSREAVRRRAMTMPMSVFECVADIRPGRDILSVRDVRAQIVLHGIFSHPVKMTVAMFVAELLNVVLRESQGDAHLFDYLTFAMSRLDEADDAAMANFPVGFLYGLSRFVGIEPDVSDYSQGCVFDLIDGTFRRSAPLHGEYLEGREAEVVYGLSRMTWENMGRYRFNRVQRQRILAVMLRYYTLHYASLSSLNSVDILKTLFD